MMNGTPVDPSTTFVGEGVMVPSASDGQFMSPEITTTPSPIQSAIEIEAESLDVESLAPGDSEPLPLPPGQPEPDTRPIIETDPAASQLDLAIPTSTTAGVTPEWQGPKGDGVNWLDVLSQTSGSEETPRAKPKRLGSN